MSETIPRQAQNLVTAWNSHDPERVLALCTEELAYEDVTFGTICRSWDETRQFFAGACAAFPDMHFTLTSAVISGEGGALEWTMSGTHKGDMPGLPATGKSFTVRGVSVIELSGDKLRAVRDYWVFATVLRQLELLAEPASA